MNSPTEMHNPGDVPIIRRMRKLFSNESFRWAPGFEYEKAEDFFAPCDKSGAVLSEKRELLGTRPDMYLACTPGSGGIIESAWELAASWGHVDTCADDRSLMALALQWEPDLLLVDEAAMTLVAACVCFPSSWDVRGAIGRPVHQIHDKVPRLNPQIGDKINRFLRSLDSGRSYSRLNWGLTRSDKRNYHPGLQLPGLEAGGRLKDVHLRFEHQLFTRIHGGVLMGIRIESIPLCQMSTDHELWKMITNTIRAMPQDVAQYKGMGSVRNALVDEMEQHIPSSDIPR